MAEGNRDKSSRQRRAKRPRQRLKDEEMRIVMDVLLYLVQVHASTSCLASTEMDCGLPGSTRAVSCGSNLSGCLNWGHIFPLHWCSVLICVQGRLHGEIVAPAGLLLSSSNPVHPWRRAELIVGDVRKIICQHQTLQYLMHFSFQQRCIRWWCSFPQYRKGDAFGLHSLIIYGANDITEKWGYLHLCICKSSSFPAASFIFVLSVVNVLVCYITN